MYYFIGQIFEIDYFSFFFLIKMNDIGQIFLHSEKKTLYFDIIFLFVCQQILTPYVIIIGTYICGRYFSGCRYIFWKKLILPMWRLYCKFKSIYLLICASKILTKSKRFIYIKTDSAPDYTDTKCFQFIHSQCMKFFLTKNVNIGQAN